MTDALVTQPDTIVLDPDNDFEACLIKMVQISRAKRLDYAGKDHAWQNFYDSAYQLSSTAGDSCETLIATKQARLRVLLQSHRDHQLEGGPANEPVIDTLLDRAVYSVIAMCLWNEDGYNG